MDNIPQTCYAWVEDEDRSGAEKGLLAALVEDSTYFVGDKIQIPEVFPFVAAVWAGTEFPDYPLIDARLASPGIGGKGVNNLRIHKSWAGKDNELDTSNIGSRNPDAMYDYFNNPILLGEGPNGIGGDILTAYSLETDEAGVAHFNNIVLFVTNTKLPYVEHTLTHPQVKGTLGAIATAATWEKKTITLDDDLPVGRYILWGCDLVSASAIAARLVVPGVDFRPAFVPRRTQSEAMHPLNRCIHPGGIPIAYKGGVLNLKVEYCAETTDTALSFAMDLEYVGK